MTELRIGDQLISFDREATAAAYSQVSQGWADRCTCQGCRNFVLQRDRIYPVEFRDLLSTLGINPAKEGEAVHDGPTGDFHSYGGWFYLVGELLEKGETVVSVRVKDDSRGFHRVEVLPSSSAEFKYWFTLVAPKPPAIFGPRVTALEFCILLPWILQEPWDSNANST
jgi:hypothetical protein